MIRKKRAGTGMRIVGNGIPSGTIRPWRQPGILFFTHTEEGRRSLREFLQGMADAYFDPSFDLGPVCVHEAEGVP